MRLETTFRPSHDGFGFANRWRDVLLGVLPVRGRCGGMVFAALDHLDRGEAIPQDRELPPYDSRLARLIWRRQLDSVLVGGGYNMLRFVQMTYRHQGGRHGNSALTRREIGRVFDLLAAGRPVPLGLINAFDLKHIGRNHQVLAYGAELTPELASIRIYDPNYPLRDDIVLEVPREGDGLVIERVGERRVAWRAMFAEKYLPIASADPERPLVEQAPGNNTVLVAGVAGFVVALLTLGWLFRSRRRRS